MEATSESRWNRPLMFYRNSGSICLLHNVGVSEIPFLWLLLLGEQMHYQYFWNLKVPVTHWNHLDRFLP